MFTESSVIAHEMSNPKRLVEIAEFSAVAVGAAQFEIA
jgi:hypothetical protein